MITTALIMGITFSIMFLIVLGTIFMMYLGRRTDGGTFLLMYVGMFILLVWAAISYSAHFDKVNEANNPPKMELSE